MNCKECINGTLDTMNRKLKSIDDNTSSFDSEYINGKLEQNTNLLLSEIGITNSTKAMLVDTSKQVESIDDIVKMNTTVINATKELEVDTNSKSNKILLQTQFNGQTLVDQNEKLEDIENDIKYNTTLLNQILENLGITTNIEEVVPTELILNKNNTSLDTISDKEVFEVKKGIFGKEKIVKVKNK